MPKSQLMKDNGRKFIMAEYPTSVYHTPVPETMFSTTKALEDHNKDLYAMAKTIIGEHTQLKDQIEIFEIMLEEVNCNGELKLYSYKDSLVCLRQSTYEKLIECGIDISKYG